MTTIISIIIKVKRGAPIGAPLLFAVGNRLFHEHLNAVPAAVESIGNAVHALGLLHVGKLALTPYKRQLIDMCRTEFHPE